MAFEVETGTGSPTATSYVSVEYADEYVSKFYPEADCWHNLTEGEKETSLEVATAFVDRLLRWSSRIKNEDQALAFPRKTFKDIEGRVISEDSIPEILKRYTVEFAVERERGNLTRDTIKLMSESFGNSSEVYAAPVRVGGSSVVQEAITDLIYLDFGRSKVTIVNLWRA